MDGKATELTLSFEHVSRQERITFLRTCDQTNIVIVKNQDSESPFELSPLADQSWEQLYAVCIDTVCFQAL